MAMNSVKVIFFDNRDQSQVTLVKSFVFQQGLTVQEFLIKLSQINKGKNFYLNQRNSAQSSTLLIKVIQNSKVYVETEEKLVNIIRLIGENQTEKIGQKILDCTMSIEEFQKAFFEEQKTKCSVLTYDKKEETRKYLPIQKYIVKEKLLIRTSLIIVDIYQVEVNAQKKLYSIEIDREKSVTDLISFMKTEYKLDLVILDKDKVSHASKNHKISKYIFEGKIFSKSLTVRVTAFCEKDVKLQKYTFNVDLNIKISEFKQKNDNLKQYHILDKKNEVADGSVKLKDIVDKKNGGYFFRYKKMHDQEAQKVKKAQLKETLKQLQQSNKNLNELAKAHSTAANTQINQQTQKMNTLMQRLTSNMNKIQVKDFKLDQKIKYVQKAQNQKFVAHLQKVSQNYTTEMLLEENPGRIFWPYYKNKPFNIRKRIIDFKKSIIQTTNCSQFQDRQTTTHSQETVNDIQKSIKENMKKIQTTVKAGGSAQVIKVSLQGSYSSKKSNRADTLNKQMNSYSRQYIVYNAIKITDAYHIDQENIALKESTRDNVKKLYDLYQNDDDTLRKQAIHFFKNYGTHLQIGKYIFGCLYGFTGMAQSQQKTTIDKLATVSRAVKSMGLAGSAEGGIGVFSVASGFSVKNTNGSTQSHATQNQQSKQSFSFQIKYQLQGIQVKNRDKWREVSGVYKKGWKLMGIQDVRLVKIVDILKNQCNALDNPCYKKTFNQFLKKLQNIEIDIEEINDFQFNDQGEILINLKNQKISERQMEKIIQAATKYLKYKLNSGTIWGQEIFQEKLKAFLSHNLEIDDIFRFLNDGETIVIYQWQTYQATINEKKLQIKIQIKKK